VSCRRDEDYEHVTLGDSDTELESEQFAEFEKVITFFICTSLLVSEILQIYPQSVEYVC